MLAEGRRRMEVLSYNLDTLALGLRWVLRVSLLIKVLEKTDCPRAG